MLKINVLIKDLPNSQSPQIQSPKFLCHSLQKKTYLATISLIKLWKHSIQVNHSIWLQCLHRRLLVRFDDIGVVLLFRPL